MTIKLPVNEIFETIQGEGWLTGSPSVFVRLQGCDVGCPWCDTKHTWAIDRKQEISADEMVDKVKDAPTFAMVDHVALADFVTSMPSRHTVITGGEPCAHDLTGLVNVLVEKGRSVQIETSGTYEINLGKRAWVTVSPKIDMPGGRNVLRSSIERADEIKMPVGKMADVEKLLELIKDFGNKKVCLQPLSRQLKATELCIEQAKLNGWRVSIQTHKMIGLR